MIVCSCRTVTERTVHAALASGATCIEDLADRCGAGSVCGGCWPELERLIHEQQSREVQIRAAVA